MQPYRPITLALTTLLAMNTMTADSSIGSHKAIKLTFILFAPLF